jgi:hypothetical protein
MDANRRIIGMMLPTISAALLATLAVAAEPTTATEGTLYAAAPRYQIRDAKPQFVAPSNITSIRDLRADRAVSGSEPDPETFDKVDLERWWSKHRKAAK